VSRLEHSCNACYEAAASHGHNAHINTALWYLGEQLYGNAPLAWWLAMSGWQQ
jgi:hypothetical protein